MVFVVIVVSVLLVSWFVTRKEAYLPIKSEANTAYMITSDSVGATSHVQDASQATFFSLQAGTNQTGVYKLSDNSVSAVMDYISKKPSYSLQGDGSNVRLIPDSIDTIQLKDRLSDKDVNFLGLSGLDGGAMHYYFKQTRCDGVPVYGSYLNVHVNDTNDIYALSGALTKGSAACERKLSHAQAEEVAKKKFTAEKRQGAIKIVSSQEYVYSPSLSDDEGARSFITLRVELCDDTDCKAYLIDLGDGTVRYEVQTSESVLNRYVYLKSGSSQRREGDPAGSNKDVNEVYDILKQVYDFYQGSFQRDSYNNSGGTLQTAIDTGCPQINASWNGTRIYVCSNTIALDVIAHEFQHGVTQFAVDPQESIEYVSESGALNESLSDIFASTLDKKDWTMGEDTISAIRDLQNPPRFKDPDSMSSTYYYCGTGDSGGVHINSGVFNKAFYLMSDGGTFPATNGCQINGIGRDASSKVAYKALTTYLKGKTKANYRDMYDAMNQACGDIYQSGASECQNIKAAMEAVGMDQQQTGTQRGLKCRNVTIKPPTCSGATQPTTDPQPTASTTAAPTTSQTQPTAAPTQPQTQATATPQPQPTAPTTQSEIPLKSLLSKPIYIGGKVIASYDGKTYTLKAVLQEEFIQTLNVQQKLNDAPDTDILRGRLIGADTLETGAFTIADTGIINQFTSTQDLSKYTSYEVYFPAFGSLGELPILLADVSGSFGKTSTASESVILDIKLRFQGIDKLPKATEAQLVRIGLAGNGLPNPVYKKVTFIPDAQGIWSGSVGFDVPAGNTYRLLVKGPRHLQKKYCDNNPQEKVAGQYICEQEAITLQKGRNALDLSKVIQLAGDVNQDGIVNSQDILTVRIHIGSDIADHLIAADVNNDGVINAVDDALIIYTLANRSDQPS